jgi:predicted aspartyl protease
MRACTPFAPLLFAVLSLLFTVTAAVAQTPSAEDFRIRVAMQEKSAATFYVAGAIAGFGAVELMVDTGSGYMTINENTLAVLKARDAARYVKELRGVLADGTELTVPVYALAELRIGDACALRNVEAAVFPGAARQILGLSALRRAAPFVFSVDPPALLLSRCGDGDAVAEQAPAAPPARPKPLRLASDQPS